MKISNFLLFLLVISFLTVRAQNQAIKWYFELGNGLDFSSDTVKYLTGSPLGQTESSSNICDSNGSILFSTNGTFVWNRYNKIISPEKKLNYEPGLQNTSNHGTVILKHKDNPNYYIFCTDYQGRGNGLFYSIINPNGNMDSGLVIANRIPLLPISVNEPIAVVNHKNGRDIWIVVHEFANDKFDAFLLTKNGVINCPIVTQIGAFHYFQGGHAQVSLKLSSNGNYIAQNQKLWGITEVFSFDNEKGNLIDTIFTNALNYDYGYAFSPDSKLFYLSLSDSGLAQIDLIAQKRSIITGINTNDAPIDPQLGPDGRIYCFTYETKDLFVIDKPNNLGILCNIKIKRNFLKYKSFSSFSNFNQSYFYTPAIDFRYKMNCIGNIIHFWGQDSFLANIHNWRITKNKAIVATYSAKDISHSFTDTGKYEVRYVADNGTRKDTVIKTIIIYPKINKQFLGKDTSYASGAPFIKLLKASYGSLCQLWQDSSGLSTFTADTAGVYICKVTNQAFCEVTDTIVIKECLNNLTVPSIYRSRDTLYTYHQLADSFVWFRNNIQYKITKTSFIKLTDTGTYRVEAAKKDHCNRSSAISNVNKLGIRPVSINDVGIKLYPNPSSNKVFIESENGYKLQINDVTGRVISYTDFNSTSVGNMQEIGLQKGVYFFIFIVGDTRITEKVIVL